MLLKYDILSKSEIEENYNSLITVIETLFESRQEPLMRMYEDYTLEHVSLAPASSKAHFHNAFAGGYVDHILRVLDFSMSNLDLWKRLGLNIDFTAEELAFVAIHHDLGKLGLPNQGDPIPRYILNNDEWHRINRNKMYSINPDLEHMMIQDMSLYVIQQYGIPISRNEYLGIKLHDGLYDESNKYYYMTYSHENKLRTKLPFVIHQADLMASQFEFDKLKEMSA